MTYVEISDLLSKGFTPDQIMVLVSSEPEDKPAQEDKPAPDDKAHDTAVAALRDEIKSLKETLQKQNIINHRFEQPPETADHGRPRRCTEPQRSRRKPPGRLPGSA